VCLEEAVMDWNAAIERNREALKQILAMLVAMVGLRQSAIASRQSGPAQAADGPTDCLLPTADCRPTLPRHLYRAVLRLLRPAEAAVRRLVIVAARGLVVTLPPARPRRPQPKPIFLRNGVGTGILMPRDYRIPPPLTPPLKGEGVVNAASNLATNATGANASESPSSLCGLRGRSSDRASGSIVGREGRGDCEAIGVPGKIREASGGGKTARCPGFRLFDPLPRWGRRARPRPSGVPRISVPGLTVPHPVAVRQPTSPDDPVDAARLSQRFTALALALDDLPGQARRFARWRARRDAANALARQGRPTGRSCRFSPLRPGRPPGGRQKPVHEVHEVLNVVHGLAFWALKSPDTS
jgi:hypothetical protein